MAAQAQLFLCLKDNFGVLLHDPSTGATAAEQAASPILPTEFAGITLEIHDSSGGVSVAPLLYVSPSQINFVVPDSIALGEGTLAIRKGGQSRQVGTLEVVPQSPEILMVSNRDLAPAGYNLLVKPGGAQSLHPLFQCSGDVCQPAPAFIDDAGSYLVLFATGLGRSTTNDVQCFINGVGVTVQYAGPQGLPGLQQINILLPDSNTDFWDNIGRGRSYELVCSVHGVLTNRFVLPFTPNITAPSGTARPANPRD